MLRVLWVALAVVMGVAIDSAGDHHTSAAGFVGATGWWILVAAVVVALVVPSAVGLTVVRMVTPLAVVVAVTALVSGAAPAWGGAALALSLAVMLLAFSGETGEGMVQGSAYGKEHRFPLRPPAALLLPMGVFWVVWATAMVAATLLLGGGSWVAGIAVAALAVGLSWLLGQRFHRLSQRWLVLVPAGVVVHDSVLLGETLMVQRANVAVARLALADTEAADLTGPAAGHAVDLAVREAVLVVFPASREHPKGRAIHVRSFLIAPTRPGRVLQAMSAANLAVA